MIAVRVADEDNFGVAVFEPELLDALLNDGQILFEIGVDQDVAPRCVDQVDGQIRGADVVEIPGDLKRRKLGVPIRITLREQSGRANQEKREQSPCHMSTSTPTAPRKTRLPSELAAPIRYRRS